MSRNLIGIGIATFLLAGTAAARLQGTGIPLASAGDALQAESSPLPLRVVKAQILNSRGDIVRLRGVNVAGMEWSSDGEGHILETVRTAIRDWHVNHVRLPVAQDRWFGRAPEQKDEGKSYRALVKQAVEPVPTQGCYIVLDLHWSDAGEWGKQIGQHLMPDQNSVAFWKDVATAYKNHPAVIFDLYNEPHDVSWDIWQHGGTVTEKGKGDRRPSPASIRPSACRRCWIRCAPPARRMS